MWGKFRLYYKLNLPHTEYAFNSLHPDSKFLYLNLVYIGWFDRLKLFPHQGRREYLQRLEEAKRKEKSLSPAASEEPLFGEDEDTAAEDLFAGIPKTTAASSAYVGTFTLP